MSAPCSSGRNRQGQKRDFSLSHDPSGSHRQQRVVLTVAKGNAIGQRIFMWIGGEQAVRFRQQDQHICADHVCHLRREHIVVAKFQLFHCDRIVLVDDRQDACRHQLSHDAAGVQEPTSIG